MELDKIEGFTPSMIWTFCIVLVGLAAIVVLFAKVADIVRDARKRRTEPLVEMNQQLADEISEKVMHKIEPKFDEINRRLNETDRKLGNDKETLDMHSRAINTIQESNASIREGFSVLCTGLMATLNHELHNGNGDEMQEAVKDINKYLARNI